ncbi:FtsX-like permease family protein [Risungbinella massiliensis]|uniref:FtsX-like permease family protein n=1 Tax=Risungbinella massiliensis TaxID=1329796 RepID=UPI0005CBCFB9|nr:FtsX-like permease family protein [Risungbinella massiliensis]
MRFHLLALSNLRGNWRSYGAFFLSSLFSVMIFYIYTAFLAHPDVVSGDMIAATKVRKGMVLCQYIIVIFSVLFVLYSNSAFLKIRMYEFGLFSLFGMTRKQLRKLILYENAVIAVLAILVGISLGILFSKLFFMILTVLLHLHDPIAFVVPLGAVWITLSVFFGIFTLITFWMVLQLEQNTEIEDLLQSSQQSKKELHYSPWFVVLAIGFLGGAYTIVLFLNGSNFALLDLKNFILLSLFCLLVVMFGTYLFISQFSILLLRFIQRFHRVYYYRTNMIVFAQLGYKIKDNSRLLFILSIMSSVILTASCTFYLLGLSAQYDYLKEKASLMMFIGMFISLLFFIAAGSMIYFKLFTEMQEDREQFKTLTRIGITESEIRKIVVTQIGIIFFVPCIMGIINALVVMKALDNILMMTHWIYSFFVISIYIVIQTSYFLIACNQYMKLILLRRI